MASRPASDPNELRVLCAMVDNRRVARSSHLAPPAAAWAAGLMA